MKEEPEKLTKRFADILKFLHEDDTVTISKKDLVEAIIELREETMVAVEKATRERDIATIEVFRPTGEHWSNDALNKYLDEIILALRNL